MNYKKWVGVSTLALALIIAPGCDWYACKREVSSVPADKEEVSSEQETTAEKMNDSAAEQKSAQNSEKKQAGVIEIKNKQAFDALLKEGRPVIAKFYSDMCGPCRESKPVFDTLSHQYSDIAFIAINEAHTGNDALFNAYGVDRYPIFIFIDASGKVFAKEVGYTKERLENKVAGFAKQVIPSEK